MNRGRRSSVEGKNKSRTENRRRDDGYGRAVNGGVPVRSLTREQRAYQRRQRRRRQLVQRTVAVTIMLLIVGAGGVMAVGHFLLKPETHGDAGVEDGLRENAGNGYVSGDDTGAGTGEGNSTGNGGTGAGIGNGGSTDGGTGTESGGSTDGEGPDTGSGEHDADSGDSGTGAVYAGADLTQLNSPNALLMDASTGEVLAEHGGYERIYPASMTKIMTALLAVENTGNLSERITMPYDIYDRLYAEEASMAGFQPGEEASLQDLLYGILLPSGAECCMTFANRIAGSEEGFVQLMNSRAAELGMKDTHFCNCTGLHDADHYSTAADIAALLRYALGSEAFREAFTGHRYSVMPTAQHPEGFTFFSTLFQYMETDAVTGGQILGGKTGYTGEAGQCLASLASVNGREYILVTAGAPGTHETEQLHILDAQNVYNQIGAAG